jgi:hypothetical protein
MNKLSIRDSAKSHRTLRTEHGFAIALMLFVYVAILLAGTLVVAVRRPLWSDELFTYYIATLPNFSDVWSALSTGHEQLPLGFYAIERLSLGMFGVSSVALRLPAILGCLVMSLALFSFVSHRLSPAYGFLAALFPMITAAHYFAHEARPYGLELGFAALALVCWQRATETSNRLPALVGLWLSLVAAISCHYYGVLLVLPLAFGELLRTIARRRIDFGIWTCFAGSTLPLIPMLPLILSGAKLSGNFWAQPHWKDPAIFYIHLMGITPFPLIAVVTLGVVAASISRSVPAMDSHTADAAFPAHELGAIIGFIALPVAGVLLAKLVTHAFTDRYVLAAVVGLSVLFAQAMHIMLRGEFRAAAMIGALLLAWFGALQLRQVRSAEQYQQRIEASTALLRSADKEGLPIVAADLRTFIELSHYTPPDIASHLVYLADPSSARRLLGFGSLDSAMLELVGPWFHMHVVPFEQFVNSNAPFLIYGYLELERFNWVVPALKERGFRIEFRSRMEDEYLFSVAPPDR